MTDTKPARELDIGDYIIIRVPVDSVYRNSDSVVVNSDNKLTYAPDDEVEFGVNPAQQVVAVDDNPMPATLTAKEVAEKVQPT